MIIILRSSNVAAYSGILAVYCSTSTADYFEVESTFYLQYYYSEISLYNTLPKNYSGTIILIVTEDSGRKERARTEYNKNRIQQQC